MSTRTRARKRKATTLPDQFQAGFLATLDGRSELARILRDNYKAIVNDIGSPDDIGHVKSALIERFVWLEAIIQTVEQEMATGVVGKSDALGRCIQGVNALSGLAKVLGIERKANSAPW